MKKCFCKIAFALCTAVFGAEFSAGKDAASCQVRRVVIIGVDGLGSRWVPWNDMPALSRLRDEGLYAVGRCSFPTSSGINWPSIFTGTMAELHGFRNNSGKPAFDPWEKTENGIPSCVFSEVRRQRPDAWTVSIYDWPVISKLHNTNTVSHVSVHRTENWKDLSQQLALDVAMADELISVLDKNPTLSFLYQHAVDYTGHTFGWGSPEQTNACRNADRQIARVVDALEKRGMAKDTAIIVTSDHGGLGKKHGMPVIECFEIPFIVWSPAISNDKWRLKEPVVNADTAPTALALLGLEVPESMRGRNAVAPFEKGMPDVPEIVLPGKYHGHLQDVWWDGGRYIYWAHTWDILKTDLSGRILRKTRVAGHNAGCELKDGKLYVAVCPTAKGRILPWGPESKLQVNEYDAETLELKAKHVMPINDRAGSLAILEDGTFVVGCLRPGDIADSQVRFFRLSPQFELISTHLVDNLKIPMGIEVMKRYGDSLYLMCYGAPTVRLDAKTFKETGRMKGYAGQRGFIYDGRRCWQGISHRLPGKVPEGGWVSKLVRLDKKLGD